MKGKVKKTMVFGPGTDIQKLLDWLASLGAFDNLRGYPNYAIIETATGEEVCKAPSIEAEAYEAVWTVLSRKLGLETIDAPGCEGLLFSCEK